MSRRVAVFGGSFNPPGRHHQRIAEMLSKRFDQVIIVPCGPRPDKSTASTIDPVHRAAMVDRAFRGLDRVAVDLFDLEQASFTPTYDLAERYRDRGELSFVIGSDLIAGGANGKSEIIQSWYRGADIWSDLHFTVFPRPGYTVDEADLPPHRELIDQPVDGDSSTIRELVFRRQPIDRLTSSDIASYISRYRLYRGGVHARSARVELKQIHPLLIVDRQKEQAAALAERVTAAIGECATEQSCNCVIVIGGDGMMLHAIRKHWRLRQPMIGISAGHRGFLLNAEEGVLRDGVMCAEFIVQHLPLLYVETISPDGVRNQALAFNDAWVERSSPQTAWIEVAVDGNVRLPRLICDGALISTAAGSTAYARAMGATPLRVDTPELLLVGSNAAEPFGWKSAHLSLESVVRFRALAAAKRPQVGFADGIPLGPVESMSVRRSRIATVELAFTPDRDLTAKLTEIQFPR